MLFARTITFSSASLLFLLPCVQVAAQTTSLEPAGDYAKIDTRLAVEVMHVLAKGTQSQKREAFERIISNSGNYAPPVFYALSQAPFESGRKDEGAFWFYAGQLRARFDANRCADVTARSAVNALNNIYGPPINQYMFQDIQKLEALIPKVVDWDRNTLHNYDPRWINLHSMNAMTSALSGKNGSVPPPSGMSLPKEQWETIAEKTRSDYLAGFQEAMASMKATR